MSRTPHAPPAGTPAADAPVVLVPIHRRGFVSAAALSVLAGAITAACGGSDGDAAAPTPPTGGGGTAGIGFANGVLTIDLAQQPQLVEANGFLLTNPADGSRNVRDAAGRPANTIVIRTGPNQWRAFTSVCPHERNPVGAFANGRITCFFHGSQFDTSGRVVVGPAVTGLTEFPLAFDAAAKRITVQRGTT